LQVLFLTGFGTGGILDYWSVMLFVKDGSDAGLYVNSGTLLDPYWKECQLQHGDAGQSVTLSVSTSTFNVALDSGGCTDSVTRLTPAATAPISHVFVVMLENHSFDNMFAMSGIPGIIAATTANANSYTDPDGTTTTFNVQSGAPLSLPADPGHEFLDVVEQLCGQNASWPQGGPYPPIDNSGFAANYATSTTEDPHVPPPLSDVQDIMDCFNSPAQLQVLYALAQQFSICDRWHSSIPGPTWPNRFFLHGASSSGFDDSPTSTQMAGWELPGNGFQYPHGSIYQRLGSSSIPYRFYNDATSTYRSAYSDDPGAGSVLGAVPQVTALSGVTVADFNSLDHFASDLQGPYPYPYTFIEPHYGDVTGGTYAGGSSQHPMDDVYGGEHLLAAVFSAIQNSPYWNSSMLIILYDEHGGFYDSVTPPTAVAPGDDPAYGYNTHGFDFTTLGVRVPAVVVSPLVAPSSVDDTLFDHASVPKLLEDLWRLSALTDRDANANSPLANLSLDAPRTDRVVLPTPLPPMRAANIPLTTAQRAELLSQPMPESGNLAGALANLKKADVELSGGTPAELAAITARHATIRTRGDAEAYGAEVLAKVRLVQQQRRLVRSGAV
jgi:phospholipase C